MFRAIVHVALKLLMEALLITEGNKKEVEGFLLIVTILKKSQRRIITSLFTDKNGHFFKFVKRKQYRKNPLIKF